MTATPANTKSLLAFIFGVMSDLAEGKIDTNTAMAQAKLASQANNVLNYELKRTLVELKLREQGATTKAQLREIESLPFSNTMRYLDAPAEQQ